MLEEHGAAILRGFDTAVADIGDQLHLCHPLLSFEGDSTLYVARRLDWRNDPRALAVADMSEASDLATLLPDTPTQRITSGEAVVAVGTRFAQAATVAGVRIDGSEIEFSSIHDAECRIGIATPARFEEIKTRLSNEARITFDEELGDAARRRDRLSARGNAALLLLRRCGPSRRDDLAIRQLAGARQNRELDLYRRLLIRFSLELDTRENDLNERAQRHIASTLSVLPSTTLLLSQPGKADRPTVSQLAVGERCGFSDRPNDLVPDITFTGTYHWAGVGTFAHDANEEIAVNVVFLPRASLPSGLKKVHEGTPFATAIEELVKTAPPHRPKGYFRDSDGTWLHIAKDCVVDARHAAFGESLIPEGKRGKWLHVLYGANRFGVLSTDDGVMVAIVGTLLDVLTTTLRRGSLSFREPPDWSRGLSALHGVFGLNRRHHLFRAEPVDWGTTFTEPQFTKGFSHFLDQPERSVRIERTRALLQALGVEQRLGFHLRNEGTETTVQAEAPATGKRYIDLLIEWQDSDSSNRIAVAIEAKLDSPITRNQLAAYAEHLRTKWPEHRRLFFVVSSKLTEHTRRDLQINKEWRWMAWRDLLIAHERALSGDYDDGAYRQFRRTLWDRTGLTAPRSS